ncbi:MAG: SDR family oxidoreductase [Ignavibacteria bacterium]|nr:SDR family oxidoreductase [Ignavibacteria bacterium]
MMKLANKVALITGAGKGIGRAVAELFLKEGAETVFITRNKEDIELFRSEHKSYEDKVLYLSGDISREQTITLIKDETLKRYGKIDILVNNAGFGVFDLFIDSKLEDFDSMFGTNVRAVYMLTKAFLPSMIQENQGTIINISSIAGKKGIANASIYCATKFALNGMSQALMEEVRKYNIRVVVISPGSVNTNFFNPRSKMSLLASEDSVLQAHDVAEACLFVASLPQGATVSELEIRPTNPRKLK